MFDLVGRKEEFSPDPFSHSASPDLRSQAIDEQQDESDEQ